ncbi:hypothetical protein KC347_g3 [Hortaea werneckii]|nr:hypothetical protein KC347_g3 [Hortaea werneckii]
MIPAHLVIGRLIGEFAAAGRSVEGGPAAVFVLDPSTTTVAAVAMGRGDRVPVDVGEGGVLLQEDGGKESISHVDLGGVDDGLRGDEPRGDLGLLLLFHPGALAFGRFFFEEGLDAHATCFGAEPHTAPDWRLPLQTNFFSPECRPSCRLRSCWRANALPQTVQTKGRSSVCVRRWDRRLWQGASVRACCCRLKGFAQGLRGRGCNPLRPRAGDACRRQWSVVEVRANDRDVPGCQGTEPGGLRVSSVALGGRTLSMGCLGMSHSLMGIAQVHPVDLVAAVVSSAENGYPNRASSDWSVLNSPSKYQMGSAGATCRRPC